MFVFTSRNSKLFFSRPLLLHFFPQHVLVFPGNRRERRKEERCEITQKKDYLSKLSQSLFSLSFFFLFSVYICIFFFSRSPPSKMLLLSHSPCLLLCFRTLFSFFLSFFVSFALSSFCDRSSVPSSSWLAGWHRLACWPQAATTNTTRKGGAGEIRSKGGNADAPKAAVPLLYVLQSATLAGARGQYCRQFGEIFENWPS